MAPRGFKEAAPDVVVFQPLGGTGALDDAAHEHHWPQTALGLIVGRGDVGPVEDNRPAFAVSIVKCKSDAGKLAIAGRLRRETTLTIGKIAKRLPLGSSKSANARIHEWVRAQGKELIRPAGDDGLSAFGKGD